MGVIEAHTVTWLPLTLCTEVYKTLHVIGHYLAHIMSIAVGEGCTFVINEVGSLYSWGRNTHSELGRHGIGPFAPTITNSVTPNHIAKLGNTVESVTGNGSRAACVMEDGSVWMWGKANTTPVPRTNKTPRHIPRHFFQGEWPAQVACSSQRNYILTDAGSVFSTVALDTVIDGVVVEQFLRPTLLPREHFAGMPVKMIATGKYHVLAIGMQLGLWSWGVNFVGSIGCGLVGAEEQLHPTPVTPFQTHRMTYVAAGNYHSMAVSAGTYEVGGDEDGLFAWGNARNGQLGLQKEAILQQSRPRRINAEHFNSEKISMVACANTCTIALAESGTLWMFGELSVMSTEAVGNVTVDDIVDVAEINYEDTEAWEWEDTDNDVVGEDIGVDMYNPFMYHIPRKVRLDPFRGAKIVAVAAGTTHVAICTENGLLYLWNGFRPALFRPVGQPLPEPVPASVIVRQPYFGGYAIRVAYRLAHRDAARFALGHVRTNAEYHAHLRSRNSQRLRRQLQRLRIRRAQMQEVVQTSVHQSYSDLRWEGPFRGNVATNAPS